MPKNKKPTNLHSRNKYQGKYDFSELKAVCPDLVPFVIKNKLDADSINFFDPLAVKMLNKALLKSQYGIDFWNIPEGFLCPPVPGRADYIHHIADLLGKPIGRNKDKEKIEIPRGPEVRCLDIGVGANCIYPLIGAKEYGWSFVGTDIDPEALAAAEEIVQKNDFPKGQIELRLQHSTTRFFKGIIQGGEKFDITICNPPFHGSYDEMMAATTRKLRNLKKGKVPHPVQNFGGQKKELWCKGGEIGFVKAMIAESRQFPYMVKWFTTLISKQSNLRAVYKALKTVGVKEVVTIPMGQGQKQSRIVAWRF